MSLVQQPLPIRHDVAVRTIAAAGVIGLYPQPYHVKWANAQAEENLDWNFWLPYAKHNGAMYMKPWAAALLNYLNGQAIGEERLARLDPLAFYENLPARVGGIDPMDSLADVAKQAYWSAHPRGAREVGMHDHADWLELFYAEVQSAQASGTLRTDIRKIKRMLKCS